MDGDKLRPEAGDDAASIHWVPIVRGEDGSFRPKTDEVLAFDHSEIIEDAARMMLG